MDLLHKCYAMIDYRNRVLRFQFPNELELRLKGRGSSPVCQIFTHLKANKIIAKGYLYHLLKFNDLDQDIPSINSVSIVNEFLDVF